MLFKLYKAIAIDIQINFPLTLKTLLDVRSYEHADLQNMSQTFIYTIGMSVLQM